MPLASVLVFEELKQGASIAVGFSQRFKIVED